MSGNVPNVIYASPGVCFKSCRHKLSRSDPRISLLSVLAPLSLSYCFYVNPLLTPYRFRYSSLLIPLRQPILDFVRFLLEFFFFFFFLLPYFMFSFPCSFYIYKFYVDFSIFLKLLLQILHLNYNGNIIWSEMLLTIETIIKCLSGLKIEIYVY